LSSGINNLFILRSFFKLSGMAATKIKTAGFLNDFLGRHTTMSDRPFCWVLGSGASFESGIPTGGTLAFQWLKELHEMEDLAGLPLEKWATAETLGIKSFAFDKAAEFYPFIYQRRFCDYKEQGYAFLESVMSRAEPSYGYSVLAQIMANLHHKVAVTTNFDNLIGDAISIYTDAFPLVCGHESLTGFIRPIPTRPVIAKIHRDLLLNPKNEPEEIEKLPPEWEHALKVIFENNTPIVLGYGGNDGSLMGFLKKMPRIKGGIFWCYRCDDEPDEKIHEVVEHHRGRLVPILGFDELMLQLWQKLNLSSPLTALQATHDKRKQDFQKQFEELNKKLQQRGNTQVAEADLKEVRVAAAAAVERLTKEKDWWAWQLKANAEPDPGKCEAIYREGLKDFPESAELTGNFALFMKNIRHNHDEAEQLYRHALGLDPKNAIHTGNFAVFLKDVRQNHDEAECLYRKALELDPKNAIHTANFAVFLKDVRQNHDEAECLYRKALELNPKGAINTGNFAEFLQTVRQDHDGAEQLYRQALELDPKNAINTGNFALFMKNVRQKHDEAEQLYRKALELDPQHANNTGNFANFMTDVRKNYDEAEQLYRKVLELDPQHANNTGNFANFMTEVRQNHDEAERLYRKALELNPKHANNTGNFAEFLEKVRKNFPEANRLYRLSLQLDPKNEWVKKEFARFKKEHPGVR
jgi:tetratricopeptide (TPR) repeat protein